MLILKHNNQIVESFDEKIDIFKNVFFSALLSVDLNDISRFFYLNSIECSSRIIENKVLTIIKRFTFNKILSLDEFTNRLLKACVSIMIKLLILLFETCIQQIYHSKAYKKVNTITLKKLEKRDYTISKSYRLIVLLNIIDKIMKSIMNEKIAWLANTVIVGLGFVRVGLLVRFNRTGWTPNVVRRLELGLSLCSTLEFNSKSRCSKS
jgi:hypothetical protein